MMAGALKFLRSLRAALALAAAVTGGAALLQWWWAGWSVYAGAGPPLGTRWLLTSSLGAALLLPPGAAIGGAWSARRLTDSGLLEQLKITRWSAGRLSLLVASRALLPVFLALVVSACGWLCLCLVAPAALHRGAGSGRTVTPGSIGAAHGLAAVIAAAFGLWGAAMAAGKRGRESSPWGSPRRLGSWGLAAQVVLILGPWLVGPLLPHLSRPERALDAVLA